MIFSEFKEYLAYGELANLEIGDLIGNTTHIPKITSAINLGLIELYKRFPIKESELIIQLADYITEYTIHSSHAESQRPVGTDTANYYIKDSVYYPYLDDLMRIIAVYNEEGIELPLNDENNSYSLFTSGHNKLVHPYPDKENSISVIYVGMPNKLTGVITDNTEIDIPNQFIEALVNYVAYRMFASINMNSAESVNYYAKFESSVAMINNLGLVNKNSTTNLRLNFNGWL